MRTRYTLSRRMPNVIVMLPLCLGLALLVLSGCARLEVGVEGTPTADVATQATVAALAAENAKLATQVAGLQTAMKTTLPPTAVPPTEIPPTPTRETAPPTTVSTPTAVAEAQAAPPTSTPVPPTPIPPTPIPPTPLPPAVRVAFQPGATSATVEASVGAGGADRYVLHAAAGQLMEVSLSTASSALRLSIYGANGAVLKSSQDASQGYRGVLPYTQDYFIQVSNGGAAAGYALNIIIPQRIQFQPGSTSASVQQTSASGRTDYYVIRCMSGQLLDLSVYTTASDVRLAIYGADGTVLKSGMGGGPSYRGTVPATQDYMISVTLNVSASYGLNVTIPERISFQPGSTSATVKGSLAANDTHHYVIGAMAGQTLNVDIAPAGAMRMTIYGVDGAVLRSGMAEGDSFSGELPSTQDYFINLSSSAAVPSYTMTVAIP